MSLKNPVTPPGIDPGTVRLVAQRLNHYATPGPTYKYSYHQITRMGFGLLSISYNLNCKNCSALTDDCETENRFSEYRWGNCFTDVRYEGVGWMHVGISAWGPKHGSSKYRNELSGSVKGEVCG
jgi:hypothetical protein